MVTGSPSGSARNNEAEFARRIHDLFTVPNTCVVGYNNIRFDDEVTRNIFYRNFYDPYAWSWQNRNSRWDCSTSCAPAMPCVLKAFTGRKMRKADQLPAGTPDARQRHRAQQCPRRDGGRLCHHCHGKAGEKRSPAV
jgi:hypothetical protein